MIHKLEMSTHIESNECFSYGLKNVGVFIDRLCCSYLTERLLKWVECIVCLLDKVGIFYHIISVIVIHVCNTFNAWQSMITFKFVWVVGIIFYKISVLNNNCSFNRNVFRMLVFEILMTKQSCINTYVCCIYLHVENCSTILINMNIITLLLSLSSKTRLNLRTYDLKCSFSLWY